MPAVGHSVSALSSLAQPSQLLLLSFFLLHYVDVGRLLRSQDQMGQGFDSLGSSYAYKEQTIPESKQFLAGRNKSYKLQKGKLEA